jgi:predicted ABC-type ATPase
LKADPVGSLHKPLPLGLAQEIYETEIIPSVGVQGPPVANPSFVIVGGQPGSGKSTAIRHAVSKLGIQSTQKIIPDDMMCFVPNYHAASIRNARQAQSSVNPEFLGWATKLEERAFDRQANILQECARPSNCISYAKYARSRGYRTELHVIATQKQQSFAGILDRFDRAVANGSVGGAAILKQDEHDDAYVKWPSGVYRAEKSKSFDRIVILRRDGDILYENELVGPRRSRRWKDPPRAMEALLAERHRSLTAKEAEAGRETWNRIANSPRLAADPFTSTLPLREHRNRAISGIEDPGQRFDPAQVKPGSSPEAARAWYIRIAADLNDYTAAAAPGSNFLQRVNAYRLQAKGKAENAVRIDSTPASARNGFFTAFRSTKPQVERDDTGANRPVKRLRVTAAGDSFGSLGITAAEADSLERQALALTRKHATRNADNRAEAHPVEGQDHASASYGSFDITAAEADGLERNALAFTRKRAAQNTDDRAEAHPVEGQDHASASYGSFDITAAEADSLERKAAPNQQISGTGEYRRPDGLPGEMPLRRAELDARNRERNIRG